MAYQVLILFLSGSKRYVSLRLERVSAMLFEASADAASSKLAKESAIEAFELC